MWSTNSWWPHVAKLRHEEARDSACTDYDHQLNFVAFRHRSVRRLTIANAGHGPATADLRHAVPPRVKFESMLSVGTQNEERSLSASRALAARAKGNARDFARDDSARERRSQVLLLDFGHGFGAGEDGVEHFVLAEANVREQIRLHEHHRLHAYHLEHGQQRD